MRRRRPGITCPSDLQPAALDYLLAPGIRCVYGLAAVLCAFLDRMAAAERIPVHKHDWRTH
jgi:hypothetical protein